MTVAAATQFDAAERSAASPTWLVGLVAIATGIAGFALLALHPGGEARDFVGVVKEEAANLVMNAVVHGGFIAVLAVQMVCYAVLSRWIGLARAASVAGLVFFAAGAAFMAASLLLDGLVTPAIAARYVAKPDKIESARVIFVLIGSLVSFLLPIGLAFQSAAIAAWGWALTATGSRTAGIAGLVLGAAMFAMAAASLATMNPLFLMGAIVGTAIWAVVAGATLVRDRG
jgi:hypothetical protein